MKILIANIGSTSFKYRLFDTEGMQVLSEGRVERIGQPESGCPDHDSAIRRCLAEMTAKGGSLQSLSEVEAIGFKAVHAGPLSGARLVDESLLSAMEEFAFLAPAHNPPYILAIRAFQRILPSVPLVVLFETAFFDRMGEESTTYAVPWSWREDLGVRRYGFHGASHRAASERAQQLCGRMNLRHISCHLGGSSSVAAIRAGVAVDTSFGISPQSGLPQNNRVGDLDAFAVLFVMKKLGLSIDEMARILSSSSGLAGISGTSGDMRDLSEAAAAGNNRARLALDVFVRSIRHYVGAFLVELGGLDVLTFSGGIGENSAEVRAAVCRDLTALGIRLDSARNASLRGEGRISPDGAETWIFVLPADEERIVARATAAVAEQAIADKLSGPAQSNPGGQ
jgi:acetate kinase